MCEVKLLCAEVAIVSVGWKHCKLIKGRKTILNEFKLPNMDDVKFEAASTLASMYEKQVGRLS